MPVAVPSTPRLWGLPTTFWWLWSAQLITRIAGFAQPFLALYLTQDHGVSAATAGSVVSGVGLGSIVATLTGGWTADRFGRRVTMLTGQVIAAGALLSLAGATALWQLWLSALLVGFGADLVRPAMSATVSDTVPPPLRVRAYGMLFWAINLGFAVSTVSAGLLTRWGYPTLFLIEATACVLAGLIVLARVPESRPDATHGHAPFLPVVLRDTGTLLLVVVGIVYSVVYFQAYSTLPLVMAGQGLSPAVYGGVIATNGVVICLVQPVAVRWVERFAPVRVYAAGIAVLGLGFAAASLAHTAWQHAAAVGLWSLGEIATAGVVGALYARRAPEGMTGRYLGLAGVTFSIGAAAGPALGGAVLDALGSSVLWWGCGLLGLVGAALVLLVNDGQDAGVLHESRL